MHYVDIIIIYIHAKTVDLIPFFTSIICYSFGPYYTSPLSLCCLFGHPLSTSSPLPSQGRRSSRDDRTIEGIEGLWTMCNSDDRSKIRNRGEKGIRVYWGINKCAMLTLRVYAILYSVFIY